MNTTSASNAYTASVATIGFFDGVHLGHRFLIQQVTDEAHRRGLSSTLITFSTHPASVLHPERMLRLLTTPTEKAEMLGELGADHIVILPFTSQLASLTAHDFMRSVLMEQLGVRVLVIGYDHRFGHNRSEGFHDYVRDGQEMGIEVLQAKELNVGDILPHSNLSSLSSSTIRRALSEGNITQANALLGYPYYLRGQVVGGFQNGRKLGYPTANILPDDAQKLIPRHGVYAADVRMEDGTTLRGMLNIGHRPTLHNGQEESIEVHLFDFHGDLYSETLEVHFLRFIRTEKEFESLSALQEQLKKDETECRK